jgi:hypothetical protein
MMGGIPLSEAKRLPYYEFTALRWEWNERHKRDGDDNDDIAPPDPAVVRAAQAELYELGIAGRKPS